MQMKAMRKFTIFLLAAMMVCGCLTGCGRNRRKSGNVILNEVAHSIFYAPMYVAIEEGYFAEEGITLTLVTGYGADKTMTALLTGEADIGFMGSESTIYTYLNGAEDYAVNFAQLTQRAGNFLVAREAVDDFDWSMLQDADILGGRAGGMPEMVFEYILKQNGMTPSEMKIDQSIDFGSTAAAFAGGQGMYTVEFEPHATLLEDQGQGVVVASLGEASGYVPYTAFSALRSYMEKNPDVIRGFVNAMKRGVEYVNTHTSEEVAEVIAPQFEGTEIDTIARIVERYRAQDTWKADLVFEQDSFDLLQDILEDAGQITERAPYEKLVTTEYMP